MSLLCIAWKAPSNLCAALNLSLGCLWFKTFVVTTLEKYQQFSHVGPLSSTYDPGERTFRKADKENLR